MSDEKTNREWIEGRYGPITLNHRTVIVATVPVFKGVSIGIGMTEEEALERLRHDLSGGHRAAEVNTR